MQARSMLAALGQTPSLPPAQSRIGAIDLARGIAIALMIVSHAVSGLMSMREVPPWGMVPIHLLTKFSSSLFIVVFGIALAVAFLPKTDSPDWPARRRSLMIRGLEVFVFYKVLTVVEMLPAFPPEDIVEAILFQRFPIWVEILGFYAIALIWLPWVLPYWRRMPLWSRLLAPVAIALLAGWLEKRAGFLGSTTLKAVLVEDAGYYTWGQLSRLPLVLLGLLIGEAVMRSYFRPVDRRRLVMGLGALGLAMLSAFFAISLPGGVDEALMAVARNIGKHPPELPFMLFSLGGALTILALCLAGGDILARLFRPLTTIGSEPLVAFAFHIVAIFVVFRYLLADRLAYTYPQVLIIGIALVPATALWILLGRFLRGR